jgi:hypothetical protein
MLAKGRWDLTRCYRVNCSVGEGTSLRIVLNICSYIGKIWIEFPYGKVGNRSVLCFIFTSQHPSAHYFQVALSVYLSASSKLVWLSSEYGLTTGRNMKGLLLLAVTAIITQYVVLYIDTWRYNWRLFGRTEAWGFWNTQLLRNHFTIVQNTLHGVRKF